MVFFKLTISTTEIVIENDLFSLRVVSSFFWMVTFFLQFLEVLFQDLFPNLSKFLKGEFKVLQMLL